MDNVKFRDKPLTAPDSMEYVWVSHDSVEHIDDAKKRASPVHPIVFPEAPTKGELIYEDGLALYIRSKVKESDFVALQNKCTTLEARKKSIDIECEKQQVVYERYKELLKKIENNIHSEYNFDDLCIGMNDLVYADLVTDLIAYKDAFINKEYELTELEETYRNPTNYTFKQIFKLFINKFIEAVKI